MFENLSDRLQDIAHKMKGYGKITEDNISDMMREIRLSLLEADVNYKVVKEFTNKVKEKALGEEVNKSISPGDLFVKIVKDELTAFNSLFSLMKLCSFSFSQRSNNFSLISEHLLCINFTFTGSICQLNYWTTC